MDEQLKITGDCEIKGEFEQKVEKSIEWLRMFEPPDGYYVAFSGGKDSQCVYHLAKMAGVKFDAHYALTSVDPPELIRFIRENYPDVIWERQHYKDKTPEHTYPDGRPKPITMWSLIADHTLPPTRKVRYCCAHLKEPGGVDGWLLRVCDGLKAIIGRSLTAWWIYKAGRKQLQRSRKRRARSTNLIGMARSS